MYTQMYAVLSRCLARRGSSFAAARRDLAANDDGAVAIIFALLLVPMLGLVLGGIDYSRAMSVQSQLQTAADSAAGSAAARLFEPRGKAEVAFRAAFRENLPEELKDHPYDLVINRDRAVVKVAVAAKVPTTMVAIFGITEMEVAANTVARPPLPSLYARSGQGGVGGRDPLAALPPGPGSDRIRRKVEDARRKAGPAGGGIGGGGLDEKEMARAQREMREAAARLGVRFGSGPAPGPQDMPDPAEVRRMQERIMRELGNLRF